MGKKGVILNTFIQNHIKANIPLQLNGIFLYSHVQGSARSINLDFFPGQSAEINGQTLAKVFRTFCNLTNVAITDAGNISDEGMRAIENCTELRVLKNEGSGLLQPQGFIQKRVEYFAKLPNLEVLDLSEYKWAGLSGRFLALVKENPASFVKLQSLALTYDGETDLTSLRHIPSLKSFTFRSLMINQNDLEQIAACKQIKDLALRNMQSNDAHFAILGKMTQLKTHHLL